MGNGNKADMLTRLISIICFYLTFDHPVFALREVET